MIELPLTVAVRPVGSAGGEEPDGLGGFGPGAGAGLVVGPHLVLVGHALPAAFVGEGGQAGAGFGGAPLLLVRAPVSRTW